MMAIRKMLSKFVSGLKPSSGSKVGRVEGKDPQHQSSANHDDACSIFVNSMPKETEYKKRNSADKHKQLGQITPCGIIPLPKAIFDHAWTALPPQKPNDKHPRAAASAMARLALFLNRPNGAADSQLAT
jgi:hypothetical protein